MKDASVTTSTKKKHAPEAKKHVKGSVSETRKAEIARIMKENNITEDELEEGKWFNREMGGKDSFMADLKTKARSFKALTGKTLSNDEAKALFNQSLLGYASLSKKAIKSDLYFLAAKFLFRDMFTLFLYFSFLTKMTFNLNLYFFKL